MVSEQCCSEGNGQRTGKEVAFDQSEVHDNEEKCMIQAYTRVTILRMEGNKTIKRMEDKKIFHNPDQNPKSEYMGLS